MTALGRAWGVPVTVTRPLCIEAGDVQIDAEATYCTETGALVSIRINGREFAPHTVEAGVKTFAREEPCLWMRGLDGAELQEAIEASNEYWRD